jgi:uncharacterized protein YbjT (DUF2867 family)
VNILITGATGFIGSHLLKRLLEGKHSVTACIHKSELSKPCKVFKVDYMQMQHAKYWLPLLKDIDVVINCVGIIAEIPKTSFEVMHHLTPVALFKACEQASVKKVIQISALGADDSALVDYHKTKKHADDYLKQSKLDWFILKPSLVYGEDGESYSFFKKLSNLPLIPLIGDGQQLIQPIHVEVLVETIMRSLETETNSQLELNIVGPQAMSYQQWMLSLRTKKSKARFLCIPFKLMMYFAQLGKLLGLKLLSPDNLTMLKQNNTADVTPLQNFLKGEKQ